MSGARAAGGSLRRAAVLGLIAGALGLIAVRSVAQREAAAAAQIGQLGRVVVLARDVPAEHPLRAGDLAYRDVPLRWVAPRTLGQAEQAIGLRTAVAMERGMPLVEAVLTEPGAREREALASGDRVIELLAAGSPRLIRARSRVDVVRSTDRADGRRETRVIAEDVEVLEVAEAERSSDGATQVIATVRVPLRDALLLAAAQGGDGGLQLLPRADWDRRTLTERR